MSGDWDKLVNDCISRVAGYTSTMVFDDPADEENLDSKALTIYDTDKPSRQTNVMLQPFSIVRLVHGNLKEKKPGSELSIYIINSVWSWNFSNGISKIRTLTEKLTKVHEDANFKPYQLIEPVEFHIGNETGEQLSSNIFESVVTWSFGRPAIFSTRISKGG